MTQDTGWQVLRRWLSTSANLVDEIQRLYLHPKSMPGEDEIRSGWPDRHGRRYFDPSLGEEEEEEEEDDDDDDDDDD
ncbi:hypothetical protein IAQ61_000334 [Plenodomus lingam]|uniref:uncharacterized protein n=1 Tax=Leptosphaeria maculans TaxID=5022 RepID=UPI0033230CA4|nr:hypothetical protein IAQ61_000334 [Plenodomus lingam]